LIPEGTRPKAAPAAHAIVRAEKLAAVTTVAAAAPGDGGEDWSSRSPQYRHLMAVTLIASLQNGQSFVSVTGHLPIDVPHV
jgi:hypothetical protein